MGGEIRGAKKNCNVKCTGVYHIRGVGEAAAVKAW